MVQSKRPSTWSGNLISLLAGDELHESGEVLFADRREVEFMLRVVRLNQVVGDLVGEREVPNGDVSFVSWSIPGVRQSTHQEM